MAAQAHNRKGAFPLNPHARVNKYKIASSQTLTRGDFVILSSNQVAVALANSGALHGVIAQDCASLAANTLVEVWDDPDEQFVVRCDGSMASALAGATRDIQGATGAMQLDADATSTNVVKLIKQAEPTLEDNTAAGVQWVVRINLHTMADTSV